MAEPNDVQRGDRNFPTPESVPRRPIQPHITSSPIPHHISPAALPDRDPPRAQHGGLGVS